MGYAVFIGVLIGLLMGSSSGAAFLSVVMAYTRAGQRLGLKQPKYVEAVPAVMIGMFSAWVGGPWLFTKIVSDVYSPEFVLTYLSALTAVFMPLAIFFFAEVWTMSRAENRAKRRRR